MAWWIYRNFTFSYTFFLKIKRLADSAWAKKQRNSEFLSNHDFIFWFIIWQEYKYLLHFLSCSNQVNFSREKRQNTSLKKHCVKGRPGKGGPKLARAL